MEKRCNNPIETAESIGEQYLAYVLQYLTNIDIEYLSLLEEIIETTNWDSPQTSTDWNNLAVMRLISAEQTEDLGVREQLVNEAFANLQRGFEIDQNSYCLAHCIVLHGLLGNTKIVNTLALNFLVDPYLVQNTATPPALIFLPQKFLKPQEASLLFNANNQKLKSQLIIALGLRESQMFFYDDYGLYYLRLSQVLRNDDPIILLQLGIGNLMKNELAGLAYLLQAWRLLPDNARIIHALYLGYSQYIKHQTDFRDYFLNIAKQQPDAEYMWARVAEDSPYTYIVYEEDIQLAVEPSFNSIVTSVLLAQGDWFEYELEFWRDHIKEGMVVIDIGANAGVYTFSAAKRVGNSGLVIAVEPFPLCIDLLHATCKINNFNNVAVCGLAISSLAGKLKFSAGRSSEANKVITDQGASNQLNTIEVDSITLDSLVDKYSLNKIDFLKIDAEGHELQVLQGATKVLTEYKPQIMYENCDSIHNQNLPVAEYLKNMGYKLFYYQPFLKKLNPINSDADLTNKLNIIALPSRS